VVIAAARSARRVWAETSCRWTLKVLARAAGDVPIIVENGGAALLALSR